MNEPSKKNPVPVLPATGGKATAQNPVPVHPPVTPAKPVLPAAPLVSAKVSSPALFGGHRGGGKKRADGLAAGSPEAIEADKKKNAARMRDSRAKDALAKTPSALPSRVASPESSVETLAEDKTLLRVPVAFDPVASVPVSGLPPTFVPWVAQKLEKPAKLLTNILDRLRNFHRTRQIEKLNIATERKKKILELLNWGDALKSDLATAAADCTAIELNRRAISGGQNVHWITLAMCVGEVVNHELNVSAQIEKIILEDRAEMLKKAGGKV
jgi:hypothetical protein